MTVTANDEIQYLNPDDITSFEDIPDIPCGTYVARLTKVEGQLSKGTPPVPQVIADFDIIEGEHAGESLRFWFSLFVKTGTTSKGGSWTFAPGIAEMKDAFAKIGKPVGDKFNFMYGSEKAAQATAAKVFAPRLKDLRVEIERFDEPQFEGKGKNRKPKLDEEGNQTFFRRNKIVGLAVGATAEQLAEIE